MENDLLFRLALTRVKGVGPVYAKKLFAHFGEAAAIFRSSPQTICSAAGNAFSMSTAAGIIRFKGQKKIEEELRFLERHKIRPIFFTDKDYPQRLLPLKTAPAFLYYRGNADLNAKKIISVIGTRAPTNYGLQMIDDLIKGLGAFHDPDMLIVSGLAYGIDTAAHKAAVNYKLPTIGVLGNGLDRIYPQENRPLACRMLGNGGLLTQFGIATEPDECNFPVRNKVVAGICDALVVAETAQRGGSMLTVKHALRSQKKIFAFPGRLTDPRSAGCNKLIASGQARLLTAPGEFMQHMNWSKPCEPTPPVQTSLFPASLQIPIPSGLDPTEEKLIGLLRQNQQLTTSDIVQALRLGYGPVAVALLNLEAGYLIKSQPGSKYVLL